MHLSLKYPLYKGESRTGCAVFHMLEGKPIISEKITSSVSAQQWFGFSFYLEIVLQPVNCTEQSVQLVCHLAGFRLQLTFQIKKFSYTIKIVLVKRLTRGNSKGEFPTGWLLLRLVIKAVCVWCSYAHTCRQRCSLLPSQTRSTAVLQHCLCCAQLPDTLHFTQPPSSIVQNVLCQILPRLKFSKRPSQLRNNEFLTFSNSAAFWVKWVMPFLSELICVLP